MSHLTKARTPILPSIKESLDSFRQKFPALFRRWPADYRRRSQVLFLITFALITAILIWRRPDALSNPQLWAEDGEVFFTDAYFSGLRAVVEPYRGYFHLLGRLVAWIGGIVPIVYIPHYYYFASWIMWGALTAYIFSSRFSFSLPIKVMIGLAFVINAADNEVFFNIANWATISSLWLFLLAASQPAQRKREKLSDAAILLLNGLNSPFLIGLWPLFLLRWLISKTKQNAYLFAGAITLAVVQVWNMGSRVAGGTAVPQIGPALAEILIVRFTHMFIGSTANQLQPTLPLRIIGILLLLLILGGLLQHGYRKQNWPLLHVLLGGLACTAISIYVMRNADPDSMLRWSGRHYYIPAVSMIWVLLLWQPRNQLFKWVPLLLIGGTFLFFTPEHKGQTFPDLDWSGEIAACTGTQPRCLIPINPLWEPPRWFAIIDSHIFSEPPFAVPFAADFAGQLNLRGYTLRQNSDLLTLELVWFVAQEPAAGYTQFVHLVPAADTTMISVQSDTLPQNGAYLTNDWIAGEYIVETVQLPVSDLAAGDYSIYIGWYAAELDDLPRLPAFSPDGERRPDDRLLLPEVVSVVK